MEIVPGEPLQTKQV